MHYEFYVDIFFFTNLYFHYFLLLLLNEILHKGVRLRRLFFTAIMGALIQVIAFLLFQNTIFGNIIGYIVIPPLMLWVCFRHRSWKELLWELCIGWFLMWMLGGCMLWLHTRIQGNGAYLICMGLLAVAATFFLGIFMGEKDRQKIYDVQIRHGKKEYVTRGLLDTGNLLQDPYVQLPVSLICRDVYMDRLSDGEEVCTRYIPYSSLGKEHGLIEAVTVEEMIVRCNHKEYKIKPAVLALAGDDFIKTDSYQMILNGRLW